MDLPRLSSQWQPKVASALRALGAERLATPEALQGMAELLDQVATWSRAIDLTAARSAEQAVDLYVADAAMLALRCTRATPSWVDVGAGGGAPGLALAVLAPDVQMTLVEPRSKRAAFLRVVGSTVVPGRTVTVRARSEQLNDQAWDHAVSRATLRPDQWLREGARLARSGVWVLLSQAEVPQWSGWLVEENISYSWPNTRAARRVVRYAPV
jgi:16S rRNA (guanine527-N7)-methyltransferase